MGYYIANEGVQQGPFERDDLPRRGLRADSLVWAEGMNDWRRADTVPELAALLRSAPVAPVPQAQRSPLMYQTPPIGQSNGMAVASMVLGIVSYPVSMLYCMGAIVAILAIVFGFVARGRIKRNETTVGGGMALAGIILGFIHIALVVLFIVLVMLIGVVAISQGIRP
jgi:hypothetical protein